MLLALNLIVLVGAVSQTTHFRFDASSETLVVEGDPDLALYNRVAATFGGDDYLFLTFAPSVGDPLTRESLLVLATLSSELAAVNGVKGVFSVLDIPLLKSPPVEIAELADGLRTLRSADADLEAARKELTASPFFRELLITTDGTTTAIKIDLAPDENLKRLTAEREAFEANGLDNGSAWEKHNLEYRGSRDRYLKERERIIQDIRAVKTKYRKYGTLHLGGVPMIAVDMITYVKNDLTTFGGLVVALMVAALALFFRRLRWVFLPVATATLSVVYTVGLLGLLEWEATVISSNFISLLAITTISLTIHLIVQYRELLHLEPDLETSQLAVETVRRKSAPCFFTALTTMAAFGSLTASGILPVEYFGWMMCVGILVSFFVTFTFFPAVLLLLPKGTPHKSIASINNFIRALGDLARWRPMLIVVSGVVIAITAYFGIQKVSLDNRFAEYFAPETEIYQGMNFIDENLGGTIPFDVVLRFPPYEDDPEEGFGDDDFDDFGFEDEDPYPERYWFNRRMLDTLEKMHRYLDKQPQVGKVMSLTALEDLAREFTDGRKLSQLEMVAVLGAIPDDLRAELIRPYASPHTGELRLSARIIESAPSFDRDEFRDAIEQFAADGLSFAEEDVAVTGMMVLFNGMLSQLLDSQIDTLSYVLLAVFVMFVVLLRSLPHALLGMIPNTLAAATIISAMGYAGVPLDMMTTTVAAICIGIGVDDTIHYLHRFRREYARWGDPRVAVSFTHASIGKALYYTSVTVIAGFSVLYFSNFVPTVMFGLWTALAMTLALLANVTLLPALLVLTHGQRAPDPTVRTDVDPAQRSL